MQVGLPAGLQGSLFSISNVLIQSSVNSFLSTAMAGNAAASNLEGFVYTAMTFVTASLRPAQYPSWHAYVADLDSLSGVEGVPTFYAAQFLMGRTGMVLITVTALAAILTGVIGAYRATVRMLSTMAEDKILSREFRGTTFCIVFIMGISSAFTFLGRNTLDWFVELTSFGATVGFAYTSAAAWRIAEKEKNGLPEEEQRVWTNFIR